MYTPTFEVVDKIYIINGDTDIFSVLPLSVTPLVSSVEFAYTVKRLVDDGMGNLIEDVLTSYLASNEETELNYFTTNSVMVPGDI